MKTTMLVIAALAAASGLRAADEPKSAYSITADFTYTSDYIFRGVKKTRDAFQPSVEFAVGDFNTGLWTNQPLTRSENNEIDLYAGYTYKVGNALKLEGVATYYWYPEARASLGQTKNSFEVGAGATFNVEGLSPSLYAYHDFRRNSDTLLGAIGYSVPLEAIGASLDTSVFIGTVNTRDTAPDAVGPAIRDAYTFYGVDVNVPYKLSKNATLTFGVHYTDNRNLSGPVGDNNLWFTTGLSIGY